MSDEKSKQAPAGADGPPPAASQAPAPAALPQQPRQLWSPLGSALAIGLISLLVASVLWSAATVGPDSRFTDWLILFTCIGVSVANLLTGGAMALLAREFVDRGPRRLAALGAICLLGALIPLFASANDYPTYALAHVAAACTAAGGALVLSAAVWAIATSHPQRAGAKA
jgi:hypothetical protein